MSEPKIIEKSEIILAGFSFYGDPFQFSADWTEENEIGRLWVRFINYIKNYSSKIDSLINPYVCYEVHIESDETKQKGIYEIFVGTEISEIVKLPYQLLVKVLPSTKYAVFTFSGQEITSDWSKTIYQKWLPNSKYSSSFSYSFQYYDKRFKGLDRIEESILDVYIPVKDK